MDFPEARAIYLILHIIGLAIGAGGAFLSDGIFFQSAKDRSFSKTEVGFLKLGSRFIWVGLLILTISGLLLFYMNPDRYLASDKFLAKMTIVAVIALNGLIFQRVHIKNIEKNKVSVSLFISGGISAVSWLSAIILGSLRSVSYDYWTIIGFYLIVLIISVLVGLWIKKTVFRL
ncbi:MAG: hypothetical protein COV31_01065 [Candidatus Yanofskybacteria bacterium CG10_big_fil_rev_8_21_14_0_10_46_23]|uniref:DUF2214 domain-containing protein n=1 Tax=Candidatus Yanofskybacteria bacterium CG10_big_fil_rev_8_21_14_0_10_46_23 TaxID=1975098 RepID=A0A2H0R4J0_9BACT|nr:MAG: hypothetical protein COV31_01065 [Candidatus Yanofskybacteria bacterium CG10_big_fil_rev_8_21_14_0_10_46_23]